MPERFEFGQLERLTVRLKGLIRNYPRGVNLLKEFIQNADDSGANVVSVFLDARSHSGTLLPDVRMSAIMGPAILIANDKEFSESDFESLRKIGESNKVHSGPKIGRFGYGFNTCYNVTDYPSFVTGASAICLDPHRDIAAEKAGEPGSGWSLDWLWTHAADWLKCFEAAGLQHGVSRFDGTIFRLPLRTPDQAISSEICNEPFPESDFYKIVEHLRESGSELLLFAKNVLDINIYTIGPHEDPTPHMILRIRSVNGNDVRKARRPINEAASGDPGALVSSWQQQKTSLPSTCYKHMFEVTTSERTYLDSWQVSAGLFTGRSGELLDAAAKMCAIGEKALPWAGAAVRLTTHPDGQVVPDPVKGHFYCGFPLPQEVPLPVHINGYFDIDSSRQGLFEDTSGVGGTHARMHWNRTLMTEGASQAYTNLIEEIRLQYGDTDTRSFYSLFPHLERQTSELCKLLATHTFRELAEHDIIRVRVDSGSEWVRPQTAFQVPSAWRESLNDPLSEEGFKIANPPIPSHVAVGLRAVDSSNQELSPDVLRSHLRSDQDTACKLEEAPHPCLRKREWLEAVLRFCISDKNELAGLPMALAVDGLLHTFGKPAVFRGTAEQRSIFSPYPHRFIDPLFDETCKLALNPEQGFQEMQLHHVVASLSKVLQPLGSQRSTTFEAAASIPPNEPWLIAFFAYLDSVTADALKAHYTELVAFPLIPDRSGNLHPPNCESTPLFRDGAAEDLLRALDRLQIPTLWGKQPLSDTIRRVSRKHRGFFAKDLSGNSLISSLSSYAHEWQEVALKYDPRTHDQILSFLAEERFVTAYTEAQIGRLRELKLFPTESGELIALSETHAFVASGFRGPSFSPIRLLKLGPERKWHALLKKLRVPDLTALTFIEKELLPNYGSMKTADQVLMLDWLRSHLPTVLAKLQEQKHPALALELRKRIASTPLVRCTDGSLHAFSRIYDPRSHVVFEILGTQAKFPDQAIYGKDVDAWLEFFVSLGMANIPRGSDILASLDELITQSSREKPEVPARLLAILDYLNRNWPYYATEKVEMSGSIVSLSDALKQKSWMPALRQPKRSDAYPAFRPPENRLYPPGDLYAPEAIHLVGSQGPIVAAPEDLSKEFREALGIKRYPPLQVTLQHFDRILQAWGMPAHDSFPNRAFESAARAIYSYIGSVTSESANAPVLQTLATRYSNCRCVWDPKTGLFWNAGHSFAVPVPGLEPYRVHLLSSDPNISQALDYLGRRSKPEPPDLVEVLDEIARDTREDPLAEHLQRQVLWILHDLARFPATLIPTRMPILTKQGRLAPSDTVFIDDGARLRNRISMELLELVDTRVPPVVIEQTGVRSLIGSIRETLTSIPEPSTDRQIREMCLRVAETIQSTHFRSGLLRLVRHHHGLAAKPDILWLKRVQVEPAQQIKTDLWLHDNGVSKLLGSGDSYSFWDVASRTLFVNGARKDDLVLHLARAINNQLSEFVIPDLAPLERIISKAPADIAETLDRYDISGFEAQEFSTVHVEEESSSIEPVSASVDTQREEDLDVGFVPGEATSPESWTPPTENDAESSDPSAHNAHDFVRLPRTGDTTRRSNYGPPVTPGEGKSPARSDVQAPSKPRARLVSYVYPASPGVGGGTGISSDALAIGNAAVDAVMHFENENARTPKRMPHLNEGYDVESVNAQGIVRYIEVKGMEDLWSDFGVGMSAPQFEFGRQHGNDFWLYVVENALGPKPIVHPIQNPPAQITSYRFDSGWKESAPAVEAEARVQVGAEVKFRDADLEEVVGKVIAVEEHGRLTKLHIQLSDGREVTRVLSPEMEFTDERTH